MEIFLQGPWSRHLQDIVIPEFDEGVTGTFPVLFGELSPGV